jgi:endoglucanase Acf2
MVWGGKGANATWFSSDPEMVHGINWLPITGASLYLGRYPEYAAKNYQALAEENLADDAKKAAKSKGAAPTVGTNWSAWADIIWMYRALSDPADAITQYNAARLAETNGAKFPLEAGNSRAALAHWLSALNELGHVDRTVTANTPLYAVFSKRGKLTRVAYNGSNAVQSVKFSDGATMLVQPRSWGMRRDQ